MKNLRAAAFRKTTHDRQHTATAGGFTLVELMVAMLIFMIIGGCAFTLFNQQITSSMSLRGQVGLNLSLRNASNQLQMDMVNAGMNYFQANNMPSWPVGVVIVNNVATTSCFTAATSTYGTNCFDKINIVPPADPTTYPAIFATNNLGGSSETTNCSDTSTGIAYGQAASGLTLAQTAAKYAAGDQLLFYNNIGTHYTTAVLTATPTVYNSAAVKFVFNPTSSYGSNTQQNDPLDITTCQGNVAYTSCYPGGTNQATTLLSKTFCGQDYIVKLAPIQYWVDNSTATDPKLLRRQGGVTATVMDQIIGFKVGATIWNAATGTDDTTSSAPLYIYDASKYWNTSGTTDEQYNFTLIRSVRVSMIGRTAPGTTPYSFKNAFDQGNYAVQGISIVVNPRNMSMND